MLLANACIITGQKSFYGYVETRGEFISAVGRGDVPEEILASQGKGDIIDLGGKWLMAGIIDDQVHFRQPGLTHKADIHSESRAAAAGGVTAFMDMPNTNPQTITFEAWKEKMDIAERESLVNYSFFFGATNSNFDEIEKLDAAKVPGVKVFLGSSTGNMLVNDETALEKIFSLPWLIAVHSEDEGVIERNRARIAEQYSAWVPMEMHSEIRNVEACVASTAKAIERARRCGTRLHVFHVSTARELDMISEASDKITAEVCVHHLLFTNKDYDSYGWRIKWNPSVKSESDRQRLLKGLTDGSIAVVATDHAPHLISEKEGDALHSASGGPSVQYSLLAMLKLASEGVLTKERVAYLMSEAPAKLYGIKKRGIIKTGYYADLTVVDPDTPTRVEAGNILSKCGWSPFEGWTFPNAVEMTIVNGKAVYSKGKILESIENPARNLEFQ